MILTAHAMQSIGQDFTVMFYNVENLFDTVDDSIAGDDEFLQSGERHWTNSRYWQKIGGLSRVIAAAGGWDLPLIIGLCEVENASVASDLAYMTILKNAGYAFIHRDSPDSRGIDISFLYRRDMVHVLETRSWIPETGEEEPFVSRNLLYVKSLIAGDTLQFILCHWPSRRGGILAAEPLREKMARLVKTKVDSIQRSADDKASIIVMGDFNCLPDDPTIMILTADSKLVNIARDLYETGVGSYRYQGKWEMIDQIIVSSGMIDGDIPFETEPGLYKVADLPFLLVDDSDYPGKRPFSTYRGYTWEGGYSDHLPVMVTIRHR
jgi:predicted extracellular nuclease